MSNEVSSISIGVRLQGIQNVLAGLARLEQTSTRTTSQINSLTKIAGAFAVAAAGMSAASIKAYDSFARFEAGAKSLLGTLEGSRFAKALQAFAVPSVFSADILRKGGNGLISTGISGNRAVKILSATTNLAAAGGSSNEELSRTLLALRQVLSKGVVKAEELNGQLAESLPLLVKAVQDQTGKNNLAGMSAKDFFDALILAGNNGKYANAQNDLAAASPLIAIQNVAEAIANALIPTGKQLAKVLGVLIGVVMPIIDAFGRLNEMTNGLAGIVVIGGLLAASLQNLALAVIKNFANTLRLDSAELKLLKTTEKLDLAFGLLGKQVAQKVPGGIMIKGSGNAISAAKQSVIDYRKSSGGTADAAGLLAGLSGLRISAVFGRVAELFKTIVNVIKPVITVANVIKATLIALLVMLSIQALIKRTQNQWKISMAALDWISSKFAGLSQSPIGRVVQAIIDFVQALWDGLVSILSLDWLVNALGLNDKVDQNNADKVSNAIGSGTTINGRRVPLRRGDPENWWYSRMGEMA